MFHHILLCSREKERETKKDGYKEDAWSLPTSDKVLRQMWLQCAVEGKKGKERVGGKAIVWHYRLFRYGECTWWGVMGLNSNLIRRLDGQPPSHSRLTSTCLITLFGSIQVSGPECCDSVHLRTIPKCATEGVLSTAQHQGGNKWENMAQKNVSLLLH